VSGIAFILFGAFICVRSVERFYYAYAGPATDDLTMRHIHGTRELGAWAVAAAFIIPGLILLRLAMTLKKTL
jgi:hypothetical protein